MPPALHAYAGCYVGEMAASAEVMAADGVWPFAAGEVVGFSYSDPLLLGLRFTRRD